MSKQFRCEIDFRFAPEDGLDLFARIWPLLAAPEVGAATFDRAETGHRHRFTSDPTAAFELFDEEGAIMIRGERDGFLFGIHYRGTGIHAAEVWIDEAAIDGPTWAPWIARLIDALPVLYGSACTVTEHDAKHTVVEHHPTGGSSTGWLGASNAELQQFLPGIYWLTVFGPELAAALDFSGLARLPVTVTTLPHGARVVQIDGPAIAADIEQRMQLEARIADALGAQYFFDRHRTGVEFAHPAAFKAVLDQLARRT